ncbi:PAS domain-containing protein [Streptomyces antimycoticus]|uniref:PAS domain-containing protein n=1 Tax=Streptomyces antimycoticus TaxID=68175 RepID=UPI003674C5BD
MVNEPLDMVYLATATMDSHCVVTGWSDGAQRLLGYRPEEIVGRAVTELWAGETAAEAVGALPGRPVEVERTGGAVPP